jgi:hypothetical protein
MEAIRVFWDTLRRRAPNVPKQTVTDKGLDLELRDPDDDDELV